MGERAGCGAAGFVSVGVTRSSRRGVAMSSDSLSVSRRIAQTDEPAIVQMKRLSAARPDAMSLSQGVVYWSPPAAAMKAALHDMADDRSVNSYGPAEGLPELRDALLRKVEQENGLTGVDVMVTSGANQAFVNIVLALCDQDDEVLLFKPYYFNHLMALQMTGSALSVSFGECDPVSFYPDVDCLEKRLASPEMRNPKMLVLVNPCNPTGVNLPQSALDRIRFLCEQHKIWLVLDNTYEHFVYEGEHLCVSGPGIINIFSFSKAYGMMGWRMGYICYDIQPTSDGSLLADQLTKVQDTIPICPNQLSMRLALAALAEGRSWVTERVATLKKNRAVLREALQSALGSNSVCESSGAIYLWAKLPDHFNDSDQELARRLVLEHGIIIMPGSAFGCPGYIRAAYGNVDENNCKIAAGRLLHGLRTILSPE